MELSENEILEIVNAYQVIECSLSKEQIDINDFTQEEIVKLILESWRNKYGNKR